MNILTKTQVEKDIEMIEIAANNTILSLQSTIQTINNSHSIMWNLPEERLTSILKYLLDAGKLEEVFSTHFKTATLLNQIAELAGIDSRAIAKIGKPFDIIDGKITFPIVNSDIPEEIDNTIVTVYVPNIE